VHLSALVLLLAGCSDPTLPPRGSEAVRLEVIDEAAFAKVLGEQRGKVVLVDFWATWCLDCMELFPHTVQLHERFADRGLTVISVSFDDPDKDRAAALEFLAKQGATFLNFISPYGAGTRSAEAFGLEAGLPQMDLYDRQGKLRKSFGGKSGPVDPQELDRAVEELLGET
jgi:thiol-disulfide isomerase/thioredoxin